MSGEESVDHQHGLYNEVHRYSTKLEQISFIEHEETSQNQPETAHHDIGAISMQTANLESAGLIYRLPLELLAEIFKWCLPHDDFQRPSRHEAPLLIAQVCTFWRRITLETPMLWASLEIFTKRQSSDGETSSLLLIEFNNLWLSRSLQCPLSLSLQDDCARIDRFALDTIRSHSTHLRRLRMTVPESDCIFLPEDAYLPLLETFEVFTEESLDPGLVQSLSRCLTAAPRLKSFTWKNHLLDFSPIELKWSNLTHLKLNTPINFHDCLPMFMEAKAMTHITFGFIMMRGYAVGKSLIVLPELQSLIVCAGDDPGPMFDATTIPKLKELVINSQFWPHPSVIAFLRRSACPLESLNLYFPPLTEANFIQCLEMVQRTLKEFTVHSEQPVITDVVLERLADTGTGEILCPNVEIIALYSCISCSPGRLAAMVQSRLKSASIDAQRNIQASAKASRALPLKVVEVFDDEAETANLMPLRNLGLIVKVYSSLDGAEIEMEPEDEVRLRQLCEEGLVMSAYEWSNHSHNIVPL